MKKTTLFFLFLFTLVMQPYCIAATIYVNEGESIQDAIDAASDNDVIVINPGTYYDGITINKNLTIKSSNPEDQFIVNSTILDGSYAGFTNGIYVENDSMIEGLTIKNFAFFSIIGDGVNVEINNCIVTNNDSSSSKGIKFDDSSVTITGTKIENNIGSLSIGNSDLNITNSFIENNQSDSALFFSGGELNISDCDISNNSGENGIKVFGDPKVNILRSNIANNGTYGILLNGRSESSNISIVSSSISDHELYGIQGGQIDNISTSSIIIDRCSIIRNGNTGIHIDFVTITIVNSIIANNKERGIYIGGDSENTKIVNCTFANNSGGYGISSQSDSTTITNSIIWGNMYALSYGNYNVTFSNIEGGYEGNGNIDIDPAFIGGNDYHLTISSPCIDAGTYTISPHVA